MSRKGICLAGAAALVCLYLLTLASRSAQVETNLAKGSADALALSGFQAMTATLDGRDVMLNGSATGQDRNTAMELVAATWGVRTVASRIDRQAEE